MMILLVGATLEQTKVDTNFRAGVSRMGSMTISTNTSRPCQLAQNSNDKANAQDDFRLIVTFTKMHIDESQVQESNITVEAYPSCHHMGSNRNRSDRTPTSYSQWKSVGIYF